MNKEFARKSVMRAADRLSRVDQQYITLGDIFELSRDLADDLTTLGEIDDKVRQCVDVNRAVYVERMK
jgi:hypothetical protein